MQPYCHAACRPGFLLAGNLRLGSPSAPESSDVCAHSCATRWTRSPISVSAVPCSSLLSSPCTSLLAPLHGATRPPLQTADALRLRPPDASLPGDVHDARSPAMISAWSRDLMSDTLRPCAPLTLRTPRVVHRLAPPCPTRRRWTPGARECSRLVRMVIRRTPPLHAL